MSPGPVRVAVAGCTGSIGTQTLEVVAAEPDRYRVVALGASGRDVDRLVDQARAVRPELVAVQDGRHADRLGAELPPGTALEVGDASLALLGAVGDVCVNGVVGFAGLRVTLATLEAGRRLALANKESLIAGGPVVQRSRRTPGAELVPVDSEHGAIHQCLRGADRLGPRRVARLVLTASGGPFRGRRRAELERVGVDDALAHPTWRMGPKITVDSSTLMNKGLEVIEAHELFGAPAGDAGCGIGFDAIDVVVHPQSIVHSMVEFTDGATIAQLSQPDMRLPIGYALAHPDRLGTPFGRMDWSTAAHLDFEPPDHEAFPCLRLAYDAGRLGGTAPAWLNAANEVAVDAFLGGRLRWIEIPEVLKRALDRHDGTPADSVEAVVDVDRRGREAAQRLIEART
ncbi:MAG: 1-deoxy-D-xylulose-5-phosphate reductoisomerase [Actinobacteria bacterium]|nr:1-deoxy-D-xylulose-5-phosphate reductoisomerase [Actinomycetota bacterium]